MKYVSGRLRELKLGLSSYSETKPTFNVIGISTFNGQIVGAATSNIIPFLYANYSDLPSPVTYHGAFAHVHATQKAYFAHGGAWYQLVSQETTGTVGTGTERYNIGPVDLTTLDVSGISTFAGNINANGNIIGDSATNISGINSVTATTFYGDGSGLDNTGASLSAASGTQRLVLTSLTSGTMTSAATDVDLSFNAASNLLSAGKLLVSGISTFSDDVVLGVGATVGFGTTAYFKDNAKAVFGDGEDLQLYHNATSSYIDNNTGPLYIRNNVDDDDGGNIIIEAKSGKASAVFQDDEGVRLYYDNAEKIRTTNEGVLVSGVTTTGTLSVTGVSSFTGTANFNGLVRIGDSIGGDTVQINASVATNLVPSVTGAYHLGSSTKKWGDLFLDGLAGIGSLSVAGVSTFNDNIDANGDVDITGNAGIGSLSVTGVSTFNGVVNATLFTPAQPNITSLGTLSSLTVSGNIDANENISVTKNAGIGSLSVAGVSTFTKQLNVGSTIKLGPAGVITATTFKGDVDAVNIDVDGRADIDDLIVTGVSTFSSLIDSNLGINVDGGLVADTAKISDLSANRVVYSSSADGELSDSANLTFDGNTLTGTFAGDGTALSVSIPGVDTGGTSEFTNLNLSGIITAAGAVFNTAKVSDLTDNRVVVAGTGGELEDSTNLTFDGSTLSIIGDATFTGNVTVGGTLTSEDKTNIDSVGLVTARTGVRINTGGLVVTAGVSTFSDAIDANNGANISGGAGLVAATAKVSDLTSGRVVVVGTSGELEDSSSFTFSGGTVTATAFVGDGSQLDGITASGLGAIGGLTIKDEGVVVGTAGSVATIDFRGGLVNVIATEGAAGVATATIVTESNPTLAMLSVTGVSTFQNAVGITSDLTISSTDAGSSAGPIVNLYRNSGTPADADYLGQIKFQGESDTGVQRNYAKITGKILDASNTNEDGIIEFAHIKAGSQTITGRWRSDSLQLLNSTNFSVDGNSTFTGTAEFDGNAEFDGFVSSNNSAVTVKAPAFLQINDDAQRLRLKGTGTEGTVESISLQLNTHAEGGSTQHALVANQNSSVKIYHSGNQKLETTSTGVVVTGIATATDFDSTSDIRLKTNIQAIEDPLAKVVQIEGVSFNWKEDNRPALGVIADQVEKIIPELVHGDNPKTVNYNGLIGLLIEAVKEQQVQITELKSKLDSLS